MARKLASIQKILSLEPIEGADRIEKLKLLGWQLVTAKTNEFKAGDLVVYIEIDSVVPERPEFEFLREGKFRIKTKRLRGVLSQGLAMPLTILPAGEYVEGQDVTEILSITKWEPVQAAAKEVEGPFPSHFFPRTDEIRVQSVPNILEELNGVECYVSVKMDGQSLTFARYDDGGVEMRKVCMRNNAVKDIPGSPHWEAAKRLEVFEKLPVGFAVQGEFAGEGIQGNRVGLKGKQFLAFQVFDIKNGKFLDFSDFKKFCEDRDIATVPIEIESLVLNHSLEDLLKMAEGTYVNGHPREGIVIRPVKEQVSKVLSAYEGQDVPRERATFKVINNAYLLKIGE